HVDELTRSRYIAPFPYTTLFRSIELGREDEAIPWLRQAMDAPRYESPQFPHVNLARIYERKGQVLDAVGEYGRAQHLPLPFVDPDRKSTRLNLQSRVDLVCRLLL